jgi:hypothetical protein
MQAIQAIASVLRVAADTVLAVPGFTVYAKQNAPRPFPDYAVLDFLSDVQRGWEQSEWTDLGPEDSKETIQGLREIGFSFTVVGVSAQDNSRAIRTGLIRTSIQELFKSTNIGLISRSVVREIATPLENGWEERSTFDVFVSAVGTDEDIASSILTAAVDSRYEFPSGIFEETINIP